MSRPYSLAPFLVFALLLGGGCIESPGAYPSLARRPIESRSDAEPVATTLAAAAPDPALDAQIAEAVAAVNKAHATYIAAAGQVESAARKPGSENVGSDAWVGAQAALADLDSQRSDTLTATNRLEQLVIGRGEAGTPPYPALDEAYAQAQALVETEAKRTAAIKARLGEK